MTLKTYEAKKLFPCGVSEDVKGRITSLTSKKISYVLYPGFSTHPDVEKDVLGEEITVPKSRYFTKIQTEKLFKQYHYCLYRLVVVLKKYSSRIGKKGVEDALNWLNRAQQIRNSIMMGHIGLANYWAFKYQGQFGMDYDEVRGRAEDALLRAVEGYDPTQDYAFTSYAYQIMQNEMRTIRKGFCKHMSLENDECVISNEKTPEEKKHIKDLAELIKDIINQCRAGLTKEEQIVLQSQFLGDGMPHVEVAKKMKIQYNMRPSTVWNRLQSGKMKIRKHLQRKGFVVKL